MLRYFAILSDFPARLIGRLLPHAALLRHLERLDVDFVLVCINLRGQDDVASLVSFHCVWVGDSPTLAVLVAHKRLAVIANFACNLNRFLGGISLHVVVVHGVLSRSYSEG